MSAPTPTAERREAVLGELAEWLHAAAQKVQRELMASEDTDEVVRLAGSLTKLARGVRQCVMLHDRLEGGRLKAEAASAHDQARAVSMADHRYKSRVSRAIVRRFEQDWLEREDDDDEDAFEDRSDRLNVMLTERLDDLEDAGHLHAQDPDALIADLCREFGVQLPSPSPLIPAKAGTQAESAPSPSPNGSPPARGRAEHGIGAPNTS